MKEKKRIFRLFAAALAFCLAAAWPFMPQSVAYASDKDVEVTTLGTPSHAWWQTDTIAQWHSVTHAHEYQVKLYLADDVDLDYDEKDREWVYEYYGNDDNPLDAVAVVRTGNTSYDFSQYMKDGHSYFYMVRATPRVSEQAYVKNSDWRISPEVDYRGKTVQGITTGKWRNYLEGSRYDVGDGYREFLDDGWQLIYGKWYYLANGGYRQSGWLAIDGNLYYLDENGIMATGWFYLDDSWYYTDKSGAIQTGWVMPLPGKYYYLYEDGRLATDTWIDGYYVGSDGLRAKADDQ